MSSSSRIQLTLFVPPAEAAELEALRRRLDPIQSGLIAAHVTLCREDELEGIEPDLIRQRLDASNPPPLTLHFGAAERFSGHGVLLPCMGGEEEFQALRQCILGSASVRRQAPHITLAHPRNPRAPGNNELAHAASIAPGRSSITFTSVCRIRQDAPSCAWRLLDRFALGA